jgi:hypothetical protein
MTLVRLTLALGLAAALAGCGGGGGGGGSPPTSSVRNVNEAESNDFSAQSVGALASTDIVVAGSTSSVRDVDLFQVTASGPVTLYASLDWTGSSNLELTISDANGIFVRHVNTTGHPESCRMPGLGAGSYTVRVGSISDATTSYSLTLGQR